MFKKIRKSLATSELYRRILWTLGIVFAYMLGRYTPIGTVPYYQALQMDLSSLNLLDQLSMVTGGQFSSLNLFSLGLSPWMTSMILWRFFTLFKVAKSLTAKQSHRYRMLLMLIIALIQAFGFTTRDDYFQTVGVGVDQLRLATIGILVAGSFALMWLGNLNMQKGIGGSMVIIVSNMILTFLFNITSYVKDASGPFWMTLVTLAGMALVVSLLIWITVVFYRAEYRIKIRRIMIISAFAEKTYLPIRLTPAGGMPFMYAMTLMSLPPLLMLGLQQLFPSNDVFAYLAKNMGLSQLPGILTYILLLGILAIGFAYFNTDPAEIAENMQKNGDYIEGVRPGKATRDYIYFYLNRLTFVGVVYTCLMGGLPLLMVWGQSGEVSLALLMNNIYIVTSLLLGIIEQVTILRSWKKYGDLI